MCCSVFTSPPPPFRQSTGELTGVTEKKAERCLQNVVKEVNAELEVSIAPKLKQPKVSRAKQITVKVLLIMSSTFHPKEYVLSLSYSGLLGFIFVVFVTETPKRKINPHSNSSRG